MNKDFTSIIISHRVSTINSCDKIIVMDKGKIVEMGNNEQLLKLNGIYSKISEIQSKEYNIENEK